MISRSVERSDTTGTRSNNKQDNPGGIADNEDEAPNHFKLHDQEEFWHPSGMRSGFRDVPGGVATLNHRLITDIPCRPFCG